MKIIVGLLVLVFFIYFFNWCSDNNTDDTLLFNKEVAFKRLASKTPYEFVRNYHENNITSSYSGCEYIHSWFLIRHGTRYPGQKNMFQITHGLEEIKKIYPHLLGDFPSILHLKEYLFSNLHPEGEKEMIELAERYKILFPKLFSDEHDFQKYKFFTTQTQRTFRSKYFFTIGLYNRQVAARIPHDTSMEKVLRFYKHCSKWNNNYKKIMTRKNKMFEESDLFKKNVLESFSMRHKLENIMSAQNITVLYNVCRYGQAWNPQVFFEPWCPLFTPEEMSILEYREDVLDYWEDGIESEINYRPACVLITHLLESLKDPLKATVNFSHSRAIRKFLVLLKYLDDKFALDVDNYLLFKNSRKWRGSFVYPFGANIAIVVRNCQSPNISKTIGLFLNENLIQIPGCNEKWCDYYKFIEIMSQLNKNCDLSAFCDS
ncbi:multiple inositol polyphosphate phosphatase 1-like [Lepeophtheirus salmonis]|uniref:multiple inositol polyphosphate phosphatase 1-like n=1 Tax=Lepeophtheirus salmonis TaxID=72036 RepID=UPI001AE99838|nr:multiple inositol polyphosphate phosphatase 1-like isoform X1 [Lepeophtheirus salmonis]